MEKNEKKQVLYEARCRGCGKLLFKFSKNCEETVAKSNKGVIIVARCTRSSCTHKDNIVVI